jgi:hypothetical protein
MYPERRQTRRLIMRVPMHVRTVGDLPPGEELVESMNISQRGAYFATTLQLKVGAQIEVRFQVPEEVFPGQTHEWTFTASVIHVTPLGNFAKKFGVGVYFLCYSAN